MNCRVTAHGRKRDVKRRGRVRCKHGREGMAFRVYRGRGELYRRSRGGGGAWYKEGQGCRVEI